MPWIDVCEPFATPPRSVRTAPDDQWSGPLTVEGGWAGISDAHVTEPELDLSGCTDLDLADNVFSGVTFTADDTVTVEARRCVFENCDLSRLQFSAADSCRFEASKFAGTDFAGATVDNVTFDQCAFRYVNFRAAKLKRVSFEDCGLDDVDYYGANLSNVAFTGSRLDAVNLDKVKAEAVDLRGASPIGLEAISSLSGFLVEEDQLQDLLYVLAFAARLGVQSRT